MDEKNGAPLSVLHVSKRGIFRLGFQNLGETLLGVLLRKGSTEVLADLMCLMETGGYCINRFAECEGDVGGGDLPNSRNQTSS